MNMQTDFWTQAKDDATCHFSKCVFCMVNLLSTEGYDFENHEVTMYGIKKIHFNVRLMKSHLF